jgi:hypothetical protein
MAVTQNTYTGNGSTTNYSITFEYLEETDIKVTLNGTLTTAYTLANATTISFTTAPAVGVAIRIYRDTNTDDLQSTFFAGSAIRAQDLNDNFNQILYSTQETVARRVDSTGGTMTGNLEFAAGKGIVFEGTTDDAHETTLLGGDPTADRTINLPNVSGTLVSTGDTGTVATAMIADSNVTTAKIADSNVTTAKIADSAVTSAKIADGTIVTADIADSAVTSAKIADGTIVATDIANNAVTTAKILDANVTTAKIADSNVTTAKIADGNVTTVKILDANVTTAKIADSNVTTAKIADSNVTTAKVADGAITNVKLASGIDGAKLTASSVPNTALADTDLQTLAGAQTGAAAAFALLTAAEVATLDGITSSTAELNILDGVTADANEINKLDGLTTSTSELNQLTGKTISGTLTPGNTNDIPTSSAVNNWTVGLLNALGGFVAIANRNSFPTDNPDPSDNAGTVVSIADAGGLVISGAGVATNAQTTGAVAVTISGFPASLQGITLPVGMGLQVQTTTTLNTYTYHKVIAREEDIIQLSDDINDFFARYRVGTTNPTIDLDAGDLFFNTTTGKMLVYDGTTSSWEEVQSIGNFFINTLSSSAGTGGGSASFNGTAYRFTLSNPPLFAQQLIASINGVVQKPNSGTAQPAEGFAIDGNDIVFSQAPATSSPFFIVTMGSTVNIGTPSDDTVSTAKIQNGAVTTAKLGSNLTVDLGSGSAATPSLTFDANTGLYSPGEDQVAISTNGTGRLFINSSGQVGVGTSPVSTFHVNGTGRFEASQSLICNGTTGTYATWLYNGTAVGDIGTANQAVSGGGNTDFAITTRSATNLVFGIGTSERMRLDSSGRLGLGTSSPSSLLHIKGSTSGTNARVEGSATADYTYFQAINPSGVELQLAANGNDSARILTTTNHPLDFFTNSVRRIRIDSSGNVGIGTTSPSATLNVKLDTDGVSNILDLENNATSLTPEAVLRMGRPGTSGRRVAIRAIGGTNFTSPQLAFDLNESERMRIDASGRLLIGTSTAYGVGSSAQAKFQSSDTTAAIHASFIDWSTADSGGIIALGKAKGGSAGNFTVVANGNTLGEIRFAGADGTDLETNGASIRAEVDGTPGANDMPGRLVFSTTADGASSPTERMRITNSGTVYIGTTSDTYPNPGIALFSSGASQFGNNAGTAGFGFLAFSRSNVLIGSITQNGTTGVAYNTTSDYRLKENVVPLVGAIDRINQLEVRQFNFITEPERTVDGFIAHEAQTVVPEAVTGTKDEVDADGNPVYQGIDQSKLVPLLTAALQEAIGRIETLEAEVAALKAQ